MFDYRNYGYRFTGPVIYEYVSWILNEAVKRKFNKIYFLARDGYILRNITKKICKKRSLNIECKYLYCSRMSLRMPTYFFIGDEAYDLLLLFGYHMSAYTLLKRIELSDYEIDMVCQEVGIENKEEIVSANEYKIIVAKIRKSVYYKDLMLKKSKYAYDATIGYLKQEGLFDDEQVVIVDSGWSGSMQRSLRQLLGKAGYQGKIYGMYFGMYNAPKEKKDGIYLTYYFSAFNNIKHKIFFENKLFECILSAPHGMTRGYEMNKGKYVPMLKENLNANMSDSIIRLQLEGILDYVEEKEIDDIAFNKNKSLKLSYRLLKRMMSFPTAEEADAFGNFNFCDDISDGYSLKVIDINELNKLKNNMFVYRIVNRMLHRGKYKIDEPLWAYGILAYIKYPLKLWYRLNIYLYEYIKVKKFSCKEKRRVLSNE